MTDIEERQDALLLALAQRIARHRGLISWDRLPVQQSKVHGWSSQEACLRLARGDLEALAEQGVVFKVDRIRDLPQTIWLGSGCTFDEANAAATSAVEAGWSLTAPILPGGG